MFNTSSSIAYIGKTLFRPLDDKEPSVPFRLGTSSCDVELKPLGECSLTIVFDPRAVGKAAGRMEFTDRVGDRYTVNLYAEGRAASVDKTLDKPPDKPVDKRPDDTRKQDAVSNAKLSSPPDFRAIEFESNGNAATLVAGSGDLYTTTDGGRSWTGRVAVPGSERTPNAPLVWNREKRAFEK